MTEILIAFGLLLLVAVIIMLAVLLKRQTTTDFSPLLTRLETLQTLQERTERGLKEEVSRNRHESGEQARGLREEVQGSLKNSTDSLVQSVARISAAQQTRLKDFAGQLSALKQASDNDRSRCRELRPTACCFEVKSNYFPKY